MNFSIDRRRLLCSVWGDQGLFNWSQMSDEFLTFWLAVVSKHSNESIPHDLCLFFSLHLGKVANGAYLKFSLQNGQAILSMSSSHLRVHIHTTEVSAHRMAQMIKAAWFSVISIIATKQTSTCLKSFKQIFINNLLLIHRVVRWGRQTSLFSIYTV